MAACHRILLLLSVAVASGAAQKPPLTKRGLLEFGGIITCSTGRSPLSYVMYGCYCGLGGKGWPRDKADCCHEHDCCYGEAETLGCQTKTDQYRWKCEDKKVECDDLNDKCEKFLCKCDRDAAKCLEKAPYNQKYLFWPSFMCGSEEPKCSIY
uniref:Phospholipase A2 n=1 Tax=Meiacanthus atrodorsalis TaxID=1405650 RepID=PA2V_MEIAT|nr:RecName: Full=Phospholipase A2; Short=PLA2; AltName: Full=Phosphatidylcholine 2-acylhydrolase 10; Flags: Precursor [Meiacanthus atrodorsalis]